MTLQDVAQVAQAAAPHSSEVVPYLSSGATIYFTQKWLKSLDVYQRFIRAFPGADKYGHWFVAGALSIFAATGINLVWDCALCARYDPDTGGKVLVTIPGVAAILHGLWDWYNVYMLQQLVHEVAKPKGDLPPPPSGVRP